MENVFALTTADKGGCAYTVAVQRRRVSPVVALWAKIIAARGCAPLVACTSNISHNPAGRPRLS